MYNYTAFVINFNMMSFLGYINNTMIKTHNIFLIQTRVLSNKLLTSFLSEFMYSNRIMVHYKHYFRGILYLAIALDKNVAKIMLPILKLDTNYGFHELFLN